MKITHLYTTGRTLQLILVLIITLTASARVLSANSSNIWLPLSYKHHYDRLLEAAEKVKNHEDCQQLVSGTLDETTLKSGDELAFTFRCRTEARQMFIIAVDAKTLSLTNELDYWREQAAIKAEKERQEALRKKLAERSLYWQVCETTFHKSTRSFYEPKIISEIPPKPDMTPEGVFIYVIEFQTLSEKKNILSYLATATIETLDECDIEIRPI